MGSEAVVPACWVSSASLWVCYWFPFGRSRELNVPRVAAGVGLIFREMDSPLYIVADAALPLAGPLGGHRAFWGHWRTIQVDVWVVGDIRFA